jgi:hypothetical protein
MTWRFKKLHEKITLILDWTSLDNLYINDHELDEWQWMTQVPWPIKKLALNDSRRHSRGTYLFPSFHLSTSFLPWQRKSTRCPTIFVLRPHGTFGGRNFRAGLNQGQIKEIGLKQTGRETWPWEQSDVLLIRYNNTSTTIVIHFETIYRAGVLFGIMFKAVRTAQSSKPRHETHCRKKKRSGKCSDSVEWPLKAAIKPLQRQQVRAPPLLSLQKGWNQCRLGFE